MSRAMNHARRKGRLRIREAALSRVRTSVAAPNHPREVDRLPSILGMFSTTRNTPSRRVAVPALRSGLREYQWTAS